MSGPRILALDFGAVSFGWAVDIGRLQPLYGRHLLPGIRCRGELQQAVRNTLKKVLIPRYDPELVTWCREEFSDYPAVMDAHAAVRHAIENVVYQEALKGLEADRREVRQVVLGCGDFGRRDPVTSGLIAGGGREEAKDAVTAWCSKQGFRPLTPEVGNSLVLHRYQQMKKGSFSGQSRAVERSGDHHPGGYAG